MRHLLDAREGPEAVEAEGGGPDGVGAAMAQRVEERRLGVGHAGPDAGQVGEPALGIEIVDGALTGGRRQLRM
jgi:hypothetical protein